MPKKGKTKSNKSSSKKGKVREQVITGVDVFSFWNGDSYIGEYTATSTGKLIREGQGKYCTDDNCIYTGRWVKDVLIEGTIMFQDEVKFIGTCESGKFNGEGTYHIPKVGDLMLTFKNNFPEGSIELVDVEGFIWSGTAVDNTSILYPNNQFIICPSRAEEAIDIDGEVEEEFPLQQDFQMDKRKTI